jgi:glycosyltransferase involved in cell wall biosynthesis
MSRPLRITILGHASSQGLEGSYGRALRGLGHDVAFFDLEGAVRRHVPLGRVGRRFAGAVPVESWMRKGNRELFVHAMDRKPELLLVAGTTSLHVGTLAQIRGCLPDTRVVLLWPDPLASIERPTLECLPVYSLVASYAAATLPMLRALGAAQVAWLPFAADPELHPAEVTIRDEDRRRYDTDVVFIGNHRPEREDAVLALVDAGIRVSVYGSDLWRTGARSPRRVSSYWTGSLVYGADYVRASRCARVCLNVIDPGNYPGANMRFFEAFAAGAATVGSACPEMSAEFPDGVATRYFDDHAGMVRAVRELLSDPDMRAALATKGNEIVRARHTYAHRARELLDTLAIGA